jgi:hypothetical protein
MGILDLTPSLQKIGRAESKLDHLTTMLHSWVDGGIQYSVRREQHGNRVHVIARVENAIPEDAAWEIVEAVGHLRAALDKMLVAIVESNGRGVSGVTFPFGGASPDGEPEPFPSARHDGLKKKLTSDQWDLVLAQEPHFGGNRLLWAVNEIANEDKHRKDLVRVAAHLSAPTLKITGGRLIGDGTGVAVMIRGDPDFICPDQERESLLLSYGFGPGSIHPQIDQTIAVEVVFGPIRPVSGKEVLSTLSHQIRLVKGIIETFGKAFG